MNAELNESESTKKMWQRAYGAAIGSFVGTTFMLVLAWLLHKFIAFIG